MFRAERSGVLSGLSRVRQISLDDTHAFCRPDQVAGEVARALRSALDAQQTSGSRRTRYCCCCDGTGNDPGTAAEWVEAERASRTCWARPRHRRRWWTRPAWCVHGPKLVRRCATQPATRRPSRLSSCFNSRALDLIARDGAATGRRAGGGGGGRCSSGRCSSGPVQLRPTTPTSSSTTCTPPATRDTGGSLAARVRRNRRRRDALIAVVGATETAGGTVQITDPAARTSRRLTEAT